MPVGILTITLYLPECRSLKQKRSLIKPSISRLHREFNVSVAEISHHDNWKSAVLALAMVSPDSGYAQSALQSVMRFFEHTWPDLPVSEFHIEVI